METKARCGWAKSQIMIDYHDTEWGVPLRDERGLFEFLILEGAQAGLSWETVLKKRENASRATLALLDAGTTLRARPLVRRPRSLHALRCLSPESDAMSRDLAARGFKFVGTKICTSLMQATGMVDEHLAGCWREIKRK